MPSLVLHVQCNTCGAYGYTDQTGPGELDDAVRCISGHDDPPGSVEGCCSAKGHTHEEHVAHVRETGDATGRPVTITIGPGGPVVLTGIV